MRTLDTMTSPWFFYVSTPQTRIRLVHRMMPETRFTSIFSSQSALSNHYCRFVFPPPARLMRVSPGLTGFLAFRLKRCIPLKMSFLAGVCFGRSLKHRHGKEPTCAFRQVAQSFPVRKCMFSTGCFGLWLHGIMKLGMLMYNH